MSERQIHYNLLNNPPLHHASKPDSTYRNDKASAKDLSDLVTRARIAGLIPEQAIGDETRPVTIWRCHREPGTFIAKEIDGLLKGYWRDLMQSQPNHIELLVEKNTVMNIVKDVAMEYCIPITSGRGYCSLPPRIAMNNRFEASHKEKLIILIVSDFDPDGEEIAHNFARSMRDDFGITNVVPIKAGLTFEQVSEMDLPSSIEPKQTSTNYDRFVEKYGAEQMAYELEALEPEQLIAIVREAIDDVIDCKAFNHELEQEKEDATKIEGLRKSVGEMLKLDRQLRAPQGSRHHA